MKRKLGSTLLAGAIVSSLLAGSAFAAPINPVSHASWMQKKSFVEGDIGGNLALDRAVTNAEVATVLARVYGAGTLKADPAIKHWASSQLAWAKQTGILTDAEIKTPDQAPSASRIKEMAAKAGYSLTLANASVTRGDYLNALGDAITTRITISHTNDVHGHIDESKSSGEFGYAKLATLMKEWRQENKNFLLIDAGDVTQGTVFANQFKGESIAPILNALDYDLTIPGNHEFDFGLEQLLKNKELIKAPMVNSSVTKEDGSNLFTPSFITEVGGLKLAFFSVLTQETPILTHPDNVKGLTFQDPVEIARKLVPELKKQADRVILVSHAGYDVDLNIAKSVSGIDLIIGGHSHTKLEQPVIVNGTYITQDWEYGKSLAREDLYYYKNELVSLNGGLKQYDEKVEPDPQIAGLVKEVTGKIDDVLNVVIGKSGVDLEGDRTIVRKKESNLGNFITDAMLAKTKSFPGYEADIALTNGGGIRTQVKAGDITKKMLYDVLPFPNTVVIIDATGSELKAALENGVSQVETGAGRFPQISGMSFEWDPSQPAGSRVSNVKIGGEELDLGKTYKLATNDFVAVGGDGYEMFKGKKSLNTGFTLYDIVEEALTSQKAISPEVEGRIVEVK